MIFNGSVHAKDFGAFIITIIAKNKNIQDYLENHVFYMDNAKIHHARVLRPIFNKINIVFSAAYSPFLNPIEEFFANFKNKMRKLEFKGQDELINNAHTVIDAIKPKNYAGFFRHKLKYKIKSLNKEKIE